ncbi:F-box only protein 36-like [Physella acuta]|uniref:F-box only protein 36-like n=1 Tax=Physella acuta TaxID=109671 RepID=UPI0027DE79E0|nr:F-box only protein 36-like [Physella acuta]
MGDDKDEKTEWERHIQPWLNEDGFLYELKGVAKAPCKDFFILQISPSQVIFRVWAITSPFGNSSLSKLTPEKYTCSYEDFSTSYEIRGGIEHRTTGELDYLDLLLAGQIDYLSRLDSELQLNIIRYLDVMSVTRLAQTNKCFRNLCSDDEIWKNIYKKSNLKKYVTPTFQSIAHSQGWKVFYAVISRIVKADNMSGRKSFTAESTRTSRAM